jgi:hypothetical protein
MSFVKGGILERTAKEYEEALSKIIASSGNGAVRYVCRLAFNYVAAGPVVNPSISFEGAAGPGTYIRLPYKRLILEKIRSSLYWSDTGVGGSSAVGHVITIARVGPPCDTLQMTVNPISPAGVTILEENATRFTRVNFDTDHVPPLLFGEEGFVYTVTPTARLDGTNPPGDFTVALNDRLIFQMDLSFLVL